MEVIIVLLVIVIAIIVANHHLAFYVDEVVRLYFPKQRAYQHRGA